ncbi:MAG TPA: hypothetical protein VN089_16875 [Duganella sp.]|nr:hypothetical protein [Duganella sp.]
MRAELRRIAASRTFATSHRCCALLDQLVRDIGNQKYHGEDGTVGRPGAGLNLGMHLAAAVQLARLRNKLSDYYAAEGLGNPLRIRVPDEGYQVSIDVVEPACVEQMNSDITQPSTEVTWLF